MRTRTEPNERVRQYAVPVSPLCSVRSTVDQSVMPKGIWVRCMESNVVGGRDEATGAGDPQIARGRSANAVQRGALKGLELRPVHAVVVPDALVLADGVDVAAGERVEPANREGRAGDVLGAGAGRALDEL